MNKITAIDTERLSSILGFLEIIDQFKSLYRATYLAHQDRHENDAEHTWHMALFALLLHSELATPVDLAHTLKLILTHDLVEIYAGDTFAHDIAGHQDKQQREEQAAQRLFGLLPADLQKLFHSWWQEFEQAQTPEARFAQAVDRLQAFAQNVFSKGRVWQDHEITEEQSRAYNERLISYDPTLAALFHLLYRRAQQEHLWPPAKSVEKRSD
jgi:putative hydrolase of HD superfamily